MSSSTPQPSEEQGASGRARRRPSDDALQRIDLAEYRERFGIPADPNDEGAGAHLRLEEALTQARDARKFEIDMYWKRAAYFWAFIAAAFVGYASFMNAKAPQAFPAFLMSLIGLVFTYAWYWVNRGSKFWQENWENHVELLEDAITGPLFKVIAERPDADWRHRTFDDWCIGPRAVSVSKINGVVSMFVLMVWLELAAVAVAAVWTKDWHAWFNVLSPIDQTRWRISALIAMGLPALAAMALLRFGVKSHRKGHHPELWLRSTQPKSVAGVAETSDVQTAPPEVEQ